jgi:hypothetical protein
MVPTLAPSRSRQEHMRVSVTSNADAGISNRIEIDATKDDTGIPAPPDAGSY